ncbi:MAG: hypothetical protein AVDCRST_MAG53-260 [uncultured Solirubrobacteraceae bacterium]|uniref:Helicase ATP-binding domain-containing protein n=1 Tax=uncultured Solirubrobacteraceae bacterium TaxID=1162706 RepID=A0A6J4RK45_9ACTN|nr:MAG: hypothetical protein AVDCRST_MAG53-260 [uncultured Solirubrobacteraceae bacterium]
MGALADLRPPRAFRHAQELALDAFEADRRSRRTSTHLVAPPGSGKTVVGLEIARRLDRPVLVLAPTTTIAEQWERAVALFTQTPSALVGPDGPLHVLTYQSLCQTTDPAGALRDAAIDRLAGERLGLTDAERRTLRDRLRHAPSAREGRDIASRVASLKRDAARDGDISGLLSATARARVDELVRRGIGTVVLDECHHLASMWGYLVAALIARLPGDVHVIGLTATAPAELAADDAEVYARLLGPVDFEIPTPAVVRDGHLAPYQELAWFTAPLQSEYDWLAERHVRFAELLDHLHTPAPSEEEHLAFAPWVIGRIRYSDDGTGQARVPFSTLAARRPELARAGLRYLHADDLELPEDAPRGEGWRAPPTLDDWLVLLGDYAVGCLRGHPGAPAERRFDELGVGLRDLGFQLTRTGIRRGASDVDRVLTTSRAKALAAVELLGAEAHARGDGLRAAVLCDTQDAPRRPEGSALELAGGARGLLAVFGDDLRTAALRPLLVTGRTVACLPPDAARLCRALDAESTPTADGLVELTRPGWSTRDWVGAAGAALATGETQLLVATRGLLGEGWDAPTLNCLVDLTTVAADVSVRQMRGRALRLDPRDPEKISSHWDVVCVAPELARGTADYARFVRRHSHLHAPCEDGSIETGVSHVHPSLSPVTPPPSAAFAALNAAALERAADRAGARERWDIGGDYVGEELAVLLVRPPAGGAPPVGRAAAPDRPPRLPGRRGPVLAFRLGAAARCYPHVLPLDRVAQAIAETYTALGEITPAAAGSVALLPRPGGSLRCLLLDGNPDENQRFASALEDVLGGGAVPRYVVSRAAWPAAEDRAGLRWRALLGFSVLEAAWHPVPSDLATHRHRADAFHRAWTRWLGAGDLLFAGRTDEGRAARAHAVAAGTAYLASRRTVWH